MMIESKFFPATDLTREQRAGYEKLKLAPDEYLEIITTGHSGRVSIAQESVVEALKRLNR